MKKAALFLLVAVIGLIGVPGPAWSQPGSQTFIGTTTDPTFTTGRVIAAGPISGVGTFVVPDSPGPAPGQFTFSGGTVSVTILPNAPVVTLNEQACLVRVRTSGTFQVTGGTGAYTGATGAGTFMGGAIILLARDPAGGCQTEAPPIFSFGFVTNTGTVTVPDASAAAA